MKIGQVITHKKFERKELVVIDVKNEIIGVAVLNGDGNRYYYRISDFFYENKWGHIWRKSEPFYQIFKQK
jgi:hypothetical protein